QATRIIRTKDPDIPIIGITAHAMVTDRERFLAVGMNGYLTKPCKKKTLIEEILRCVPKISSSSTQKEKESRLDKS
ncbi:MAG: response regulator, partial [Alphaproteobacteria bacterium]|nr:response regulator [Alphaproteobacteria bacterium]